jgi:hypothetical protein
MKEKSFITLTPGGNLIKRFPSPLMTRLNKQEGLSLETFSSQVLEFEGKARANPIGASFRCFLLGYAFGVISKCLLIVEAPTLHLVHKQ